MRSLFGRRIPWVFVSTLLLFAAWLGCAAGGDYAPSSESYGWEGEQKAARGIASGDKMDWGDDGGLAGAVSAPEEVAYLEEDALASVDRLATLDVDGAREKSSAVEGRKLIRTGDISVTVEDYDPFRDALDAKLEALGGFVADANLDHYSGRVSWATLTVRVSADAFEELVGWTESQVEVNSLNISTQDVTAEWVDIRSRLDNWKATEKRLLEILQDQTADLGDVLAVERELSRVREEIERAEGQMRVLADQVELATLTIHVSVRNPYQPAVDPPGFGQRIGDVFMGSLEAMLNLGKGIVLLTVGAAPWLLVMFVFLYVCYRFVRMLVRRKSA